MVQSEWQATESLRKCLRAFSVAATCAGLKERHRLFKRHHIQRDLLRQLLLQSEKRDVISTRAPAEGSSSVTSSGEVALS